MKKKSIKRYLKPYKIYQNRRTTVNNAFASALAPNDDYDECVLDEAIRHLGQNPDEDLLCVYCDEIANTWDHVVGLVKNSEFRGFGHQLGNLVPCCKECNSKKGRKDWREFVHSEIADEEKIQEITRRLNEHIERNAKSIDMGRAEQLLPDEFRRYRDVKKEIFELMNEADAIAEKIRAIVV